MANALLYVAELCSSVKHHVIPLLPLFMPAIIQVTADLSFLARFVFFIVVLCCMSENYRHPSLQCLLPKTTVTHY